MSHVRSLFRNACWPIPEPEPQYVPNVAPVVVLLYSVNSDV
jgi:hypothetical protein